MNSRHTRRGKTRRRRHTPGRCASVAATRPRKHPETASAVRAALLVAHRQGFARKPEWARLPAAKRALPGPLFGAVAATPHPTGRWTDYRPGRPRSPVLRADPSGDTLDSLRPCERHPDRTVRAAVRWMPPEHRGHTASARRHKDWVAAPSLLVPPQSLQESRCALALLDPESGAAANPVERRANPRDCLPSRNRGLVVRRPTEDSSRDGPK